MTKRSILLSFAALCFSLSSLAVGHWELQSKAYTVDTLYHAKIGPGTTQTSLSLTGGSNLKIFYITTDLTHPNVDIRVAQAGSKLTGGAKLSTMSNANTNVSQGIEYFAGVNADFFGNSQPIGSSIVNGEVYKASANNSWISFYMNDGKVPGIEQLQFTGTATSPAGTHAVAGINDSRSTDYLILFTDHYAANTGTNQYGSEVVVSCDKTISYNGKYTCTVEQAPVSGQGSMTIPAGKYVLSGHGTAAQFVNSLNVGDKIELDLNTELATGGIVTQMAGGQPIILQNGVTLETQYALDHLTALNPRTAVGYNADRTKLVLLVVDGRNMGGSAGVVSKVLADIMRNVGCSDAMNFDGGGSSELYTRAFGVRNVPSDGSERTVVNSVWAVSNAPVDNEVAELYFSQQNINLPKYGYYQPTLYAFNKYDVLMSTDWQDYELSCPPELGQIVDGKTLFANGEGTHFLTATCGDVTAQIAVTIGSAQPRARLEQVIVDSYKHYKAEIIATVEQKDMAIDNAAFVWSSSDPQTVTVDEAGLIKGIADGEAVINAKVEDFNVNIPVKVQIPKTRYVSIKNSDDISAWTTTKSGLSTATLSENGNGFNIDYKINNARAPYFTLKPVNECEMFSLPDSIRMVINPGNGTISRLVVNVKPFGKSTASTTLTLSLTKNANNIITIPVSDFCDAKDHANFPLTFSQATFYLSGSTADDEVHLQIPEFSTVYTSVNGSAGVDDITFDSSARGENILLRNVVTKGEIVELVSASPWLVYNMSGMIVAQGSGDSIDSSLLNPGNYIVSTNMGASRLIVR